MARLAGFVSVATLVIAVVLSAPSASVRSRSAAPASGTLSAYPSTLTKSGDFVQLTYNVTGWRKGDRIGIYSPPWSEKSLGVLSVPEGTRRGFGEPVVASGSLSVSVANLRLPYVFRYEQVKEKGAAASSGAGRGGPAPGVVVAESQEVVFGWPLEPTGVHLALTGLEGQMMVSWTSNRSSEGTPGIFYGSGTISNLTVAANTQVTYSASDMCTAPANDTENFRDPGYTFTAVIAGLTPGEPFWYQVGHFPNDMSEPIKAMAAPALSGFTPVSVAIFGDMGVSERFGSTSFAKVYPQANRTATYLEAAVTRGDVDLVVLIGDLSYARGYAAQWDQWLVEVEPIASRVPLHVSIGNHEMDYEGQKFKPSWANYGSDSGGECGVPYVSRFPTPYSSGRGNLWYSFRQGPIHFLIMSMEHDFTAGSDQFDFIQADLAGVNRTETPFVIVAGHRPVYTSFFRDDGLLGEQLIASIEPLMVKFGVDAFLAGHVHEFEYTTRIVNWHPNPQGPMHFLVGSGGNDYQVPPTFPQPEWSVYRSYQYGFGLLKAHSPSDLEFQFITDEDGSVAKSVWIRGGPN